jgi:ABC-2 type transport system ATP-binding protein
VEGASIITTEGLTFAYGDIVALDGVTLDVPAGRTGLVGANGAGKTTLLKLLLGILDPGTGDVTVLGHDTGREELEVRARVGYMPEASCLPKDQTATDFVGYAAELAGLPPKAARQRASDVLNLVGLHEERFRAIGEFSTGMAQRTNLAQAIVHHPDLVLLDEPTAGLDPEGREEMLDLIRRLGDFGINVVVSSHVLPDIERTCEWVVMLDGGRVLRSAPLAELEITGTVEVEALDDPAGVVVALRAAGAAVEVDGFHLLVTHDDADPYVLVRDAFADHGVGLRRLGVRSTSLEDVFLGAGPPAGAAP